MKKLILTIMTLSIITFTGCYDPDTATVRINLVNIPIAPAAQVSFIERVLNIFESRAYASIAEEYVQKLHVAAVSGDSVIASAGIDAADVADNSMGEGSYVELSVPAGKNISIVVAGEITGYVNDELMNYIFYYGHYTTDLEAGSTVTLPIQMNIVDSNWINFNRQYTNYPYYLYWDKKPGAVITITDDFGGLVYHGTGTRVYVDESVIGNTYYVTAGFGFTGKATQIFDYGW